MISFVGVMKDAKYKLQKSGYSYIDFLKKNGITDELSLSIAKKHGNVYLSNEVGMELENISNYNKEKVFVYKATENDKMDDIFNNGLPVSKKSSDIAEVSSKSENLWSLTEKIASMKKNESVYLLNISDKDFKGAEPIFYYDGNVFRILPEYVYGLAFLNKGEIHIINNPNYKNIHTRNAETSVEENHSMSK